ncbi:MAG: DUF72 domain-containing protein [Ferruginibacter sp.]
MSKKIDWHIGCSGFHYKEWKDTFYPKGLPATKWFTYYNEHFNTFEINATFYRTPTLKSLLKWYSDSHADFLFSVKAPRIITHYKKFQNSLQDITDFYALISEGLQEKLSCILFQLPPSFSYTEERLNNIITQLNPSFINVVEFRHTSWWNKDVYKAFEKNNITFCNVSYPNFPDDIIATSPIYYFRFHGVPELYRSAYSHEYLATVIKKIKTENIKSAWLYFNNTAGLGAIENANYIKSIV